MEHLKSYCHRCSYNFKRGRTDWIVENLIHVSFWILYKTDFVLNKFGVESNMLLRKNTGAKFNITIISHLIRCVYDQERVFTIKGIPAIINNQEMTVALLVK